MASSVPVTCFSDAPLAQEKAPVSQTQPLKKILSVPLPLDVPGPFNAPLSEEEVACTLERAPSCPLSGDDRLRILETFIVVQELNGNTRDLGWFGPDQSVEELRKQISKEMCVPMEALKLVRDSSADTVSSSTSNASLDNLVSAPSTASLESNSSSLGELWSPQTPGIKLNAVVQMPPEYEEFLKCYDDVRVHENAYNRLVTLASEFESPTPANANLVKRIINIIENALHDTTNKASRGWAIGALTKLLVHLIKQFRLLGCKSAKACCERDLTENLRETISRIGEIFKGLSGSTCWLERQEAEEAMHKIKAVAALDTFVCGAESYSASRKAQLGGA
jgi:hypothetical protein